MQKFLPPDVAKVYESLRDNGYKVYLVGGCVRDLLLEKEIKDWDMTTNATPEEITKLFPDSFYDNTFGTVGIAAFFDNKPHVIEITTFRTEQEYIDSRHPSSVSWGKTIEEDLERRDFTINAMALEIKNPSSPKPILENAELIDPFDGQEDLQNTILRAVGDPTKRFKEDALRLMRAIRFATQLSFTIEKDTWDAMLKDSVLLTRISAERIRDEFLKILSSNYPYEGIILLKNVNVLQYILPELLEGIGVSQARPGRHHVYDVFEHNVLSLKSCPSKDPIVRFATLIHDIGKPRVTGKDQNGLVIFYNHEVMGARVAYEICNRLHFSKKEREKVVKLIRWHMFTVDEHITDAAVRRFIRRVGVDNVKDMIDLRIGDRLGSGIPEERAESWRLKLFKDRIEKELAPGPFSINDLAIDGNDIMKELHIKPGPQIGKLLMQLFEEVDEDLSKNTKEYLLTRVKELFAQAASSIKTIDVTKIVLESQRLKLLPLSETYAEEMFKEFTKEITTYMFPKSPEKIEDTLEYIRSMQPKMQKGEEFPIVILDKNTKEFLGCGGIHKINTPTPELGIWIKKSAHGKGYGKEAVSRLKKWIEETVEYTYMFYPVDKANTASRKLIESIGGTIAAEYKQKTMSGNTLNIIEYRIYKTP